MADYAQIRRRADEVWAKFGRVDAAFNNVGMSPVTRCRGVTSPKSRSITSSRSI